MIKVFSSGKIIRLLSEQGLYKPIKGSLMVTVSSDKEMSELYAQLINNDDLQEICFFNPDPNFLFNAFKSMFKLVEAAGGLVKNANGEYLFIFRNGKWDLPKGKIEKGESIENAAVREVEEECGISKLIITKKLAPTYHTYFINEKAVLKPTYWFEMKCSDTSKLIPQEEEGITDVRWVAVKDLEMVKKNTYESILDVIENL